MQGRCSQGLGLSEHPEKGQSYVVSWVRRRAIAGRAQNRFRRNIRGGWSRWGSSFLHPFLRRTRCRVKDVGRMYINATFGNRPKKKCGSLTGEATDSVSLSGPASSPSRLSMFRTFLPSPHVETALQVLLVEMDCIQSQFFASERSVFDPLRDDIRGRGDL